jgi:hypothetical protein
MKDNFDVHEWNKKRYLDELEIDQEDDNVNQDNEDGSLNITHGGDDPKIGAELEAGVIGDKLAEAPGRRQATMKLNQLTFNVVKSMFGKIPMFGLSFPNADDSYRSVFDADDLENWKAGIRERYGDVNIRIDVEAASTWDRIQILDDKFRGDKEGYIKGKAATLDQWRKSSNYGFDENLNEASYMYKGYEDKHFDICPVAETLRDELLAGKFKENKWATGTNFEAELGEWRYQNDVLFKTEKQVLQDKEGDERDIEKAKVAIDRIVNLSRDLGIPAAEISYLKAHLKKITDIVEYSSLTESIKETLRFIKEHNPDFTNEEIKELGSQLNEKLCKKGEAYRKRRMAAGEKSSAYLSGRAVKVCKGQMSGKKKKK